MKYPVSWWQEQSYYRLTVKINIRYNNLYHIYIEREEYVLIILYIITYEQSSSVS